MATANPLITSLVKVCERPDLVTIHGEGDGPLEKVPAAYVHRPGTVPKTTGIPFLSLTELVVPVLPWASFWGWLGVRVSDEDCK